jgi:hypothetical protein
MVDHSIKSRVETPPYRTGTFGKRMDATQLSRVDYMIAMSLKHIELDPLALRRRLDPTQPRTGSLPLDLRGFAL